MLLSLNQPTNQEVLWGGIVIGHVWWLVSSFINVFVSSSLASSCWSQWRTVSTSGHWQSAGCYALRALFPVFIVIGIVNVEKLEISGCPAIQCGSRSALFCLTLFLFTRWHYCIRIRCCFLGLCATILTRSTSTQTVSCGQHWSTLTSDRLCWLYRPAWNMNVAKVAPTLGIIFPVAVILVCWVLNSCQTGCLCSAVYLAVDIEFHTLCRKPPLPVIWEKFSMVSLCALVGHQLGHAACINILIQQSINN